GRDIRQMFASIAPTYDLLNTLLSLGFDASWRQKAVELTAPNPEARVLDLCAGTAELALTFAKRLGQKGYVVASDFCWEMIELARPKLKKTIPPLKKGGGGDFTSSITCPVVLLQADALHLPFPDNTFDVASVAFGIRNVSSLNQCLKEMVRALRPGGKVVILEFSLPQGPIFGRLYNFYLNKLLPWVGNFIAPGRLKAYSYLPASVGQFVRPEELKREMESCGLIEVQSHPLTLGIVTVYVGRRP
ncbi:MAG TPA: bifunctional demethylmenaquinone methyltransferase/2-methoxy-6-polyprenyl-1,4-benzoquinol methylase UbiE, partial [Candidatus Hypogeohydataceae bacterium YC41]